MNSGFYLMTLILAWLGKGKNANAR